MVVCRSCANRGCSAYGLRITPGVAPHQAKCDVRRIECGGATPQQDCDQYDCGARQLGGVAQIWIQGQQRARYVPPDFAQAVRECENARSWRTWTMNREHDLLRVPGTSGLRTTRQTRRQRRTLHAFTMGNRITTRPGTSTRRIDLFPLPSSAPSRTCSRLPSRLPAPCSRSSSPAGQYGRGSCASRTRGSRGQQRTLALAPARAAAWAALRDPDEKRVSRRRRQQIETTRRSLARTSTWRLRPEAARGPGWPLGSR